MEYPLTLTLRSPFPWFLPVFFTCMIAHRAWRDIHRCRNKYGDAWKEYERQVPYLFIPVSLLPPPPPSLISTRSANVMQYVI
jgi:Delta24(24(1))-sterol reductase